jgi:hypothetical protein
MLRTNSGRIQPKDTVATSDCSIMEQSKIEGRGEGTTRNTIRADLARRRFARVIAGSVLTV